MCWPGVLEASDAIDIQIKNIMSMVGPWASIEVQLKMSANLHHFLPLPVAGTPSPWIEMGTAWLRCVPRRRTGCVAYTSVPLICSQKAVTASCPGQIRVCQLSGYSRKMEAKTSCSQKARCFLVVVPDFSFNGKSRLDASQSLGSSSLATRSLWQMLACAPKHPRLASIWNSLGTLPTRRPSTTSLTASCAIVWTFWGVISPRPSWLPETGRVGSRHVPLQPLQPLAFVESLCASAP